jgi:hypothetical protein
VSQGLGVNPVRLDARLGNGPHLDGRASTSSSTSSYGQSQIVPQLSDHFTSCSGRSLTEQESCGAQAFSSYLVEQVNHQTVL